MWSCGLSSPVIKFIKTRTAIGPTLKMNLNLLNTTEDNYENTTCRSALDSIRSNHRSLRSGYGQGDCETIKG